ncbi:molybdate ABC transporter permease subunit [Gilvibacter sediminis]|uniref:molybdate ABC transporter permease subunit n=1 Tax=Gilvibacter sediminis TaxID=379071 RepID=UPI002350E512|nr:molybdate ABC transporter permease subunit [Gilvibacter sediminis]MDC7998151.1 molybdate ABC transporter permease subunit [Gilvibacter sediminis]
MLSLSSVNWDPLFLTFKLALVTTLVLLLVGIPLGYWLAYSKSRLKPLLAVLVSMPLVLPPTVIGFYLLLAFSPNNALGAWLEQTFNLRLVFSFTGLVIASVIYGIPFMVHPIQSGLRGLPSAYKESAQLMGRNRFSILTRVLLPNMKPALLSGIVLSFAHTLGEFGVVLMIGGSIPGETRVASIAIYDEVERLNFGQAHLLSLILFAVAFIILLWVYTRGSKHWKGVLR